MTGSREAARRLRGVVANSSARRPVRALGTSLLRSQLKAAQAPRNRKAVIVTVGGRARDDETFMPGGTRGSPGRRIERAH